MCYYMFKLFECVTFFGADLSFLISPNNDGADAFCSRYHQSLKRSKGN